eukprot:gene21857-biopygen17679
MGLKVPAPRGGGRRRPSRAAPPRRAAGPPAGRNSIPQTLSKQQQQVPTENIDAPRLQNVQFDPGPGLEAIRWSFENKVSTRR